MRVVIVTGDFPPLDGGVATWTAAMADGLRAAGHEVVVHARARRGLAAGVVPIPGPSFGRWGPWWTALRVRDVRRGDLVLATTWPLASRIAARVARAGARLVIAGHGSDLTRGVFVPPAPARWVVPSRFLAGCLATRGIDATVLPAPIDTGPAPAAAGAHWAFVGRVTPLKGVDRFLRLAAAAGVPATVVGDGPALPACRALAAALAADVTFTGRLPRDEVLSRLSSFSAVFLLPRPDADGGGAEGFGLALVEAAAAGVVPVGCATGGVPEAVGPGVILADPDDVPGSLAQLRLGLRADRGEACRAWVAARHGVGRAVAGLLAV